MSGVEEEIHDFDESEMTMTMEEVVTPLQQEVFTLKAQVADQSARAQATEITTTVIDLEFLPNVTNVERGIQNLECVARDA